MIDIKKNNKWRCCGCNACAESCPNNAIRMVPDEEGFQYPSVDRELCSGCNLCNKICAFAKSSPEDHSPLRVLAAQSNSVDILKASTSGGIFTVLSDYVFHKNGVVYGAAFDKNLIVRHLRAETPYERDQMRGSKYVQSDTCGIYKKVKRDLKDKKLVLFTGTPCQIDGLMSFLGNMSTDNLICCDLICNGVPSPLIWKEYVKFLEHKRKSKMTSYQFRPKDWGWHNKNCKCIFENGLSYHSDAYTNLFKELYYLRFISRSSCHKCRYMSTARVSDITIGDCRGIDKVIPDFPSYNGVSLVLVNTVKGLKVFESISSNLNYMDVNLKELMQPPLDHSSNPNTNRNEFWGTYFTRGFQAAIFKVFGKYYALKFFIRKLLNR